MNDIPAKVEECLLNKSLCMLLSMGPKNRPKTKAKLQNALRPCTAVVPYANPLDMLAAANKSSTQPAPSVNIPHAKKRVYVDLKTLKEKFDEHIKGLQMQIVPVAPQGSEPDKSIVDDVIAWLQSEPEGTEESLINEVLKRCKKVVGTESPDDVLKHLKKNESVKVDDCWIVSYNFSTCGKTLADYINYFRHGKDHSSASAELGASSSGQLTPESSSLSHTSAVVLYYLHGLSLLERPSTESGVLRVIVSVCKTFFTVPPSRLLGMNTGLIKHRQIKPTSKEKVSKEKKKTLKAMEQKKSEVEVGSPDKGKAELPKKPKMKLEFAIGVLPGENNIQEQIPITPEGLTGIKVCMQDSSAQQAGAKSVNKITNEKVRAISQCRELTAYLKGRLTVAARNNSAILIAADEEEKKVMTFKVVNWIGLYQSQCSGMATTEIDVAKLQKELINICVGRVRHLASTTLTAMLQKAGFITIDDKQSVMYHLPANRDKISSWQEDTIKAAIQTCCCSNMLKRAFRKKKKVGRKKRKTVVKKRKVCPQIQSSPESASYCFDDIDFHDDDYGYGDDIVDYDDDYYGGDDYGCGDDYDDLF